MPGIRPKRRLVAVVESIVEYLESNPAAGDTVEGIHGVWLGGFATYTEVEQAIRLLVARGDLIARPLPDGSVLYGRGPAGD